MKRFVWLIAFVAFLLPLPAFAGTTNINPGGAYQFGYNQSGQRSYSSTNAMGLAPAWDGLTGLSYSQPDILDGTTMGTPNGLPGCL